MSCPWWVWLPRGAPKRAPAPPKLWGPLTGKAQSDAGGVVLGFCWGAGWRWRFFFRFFFFLCFAGAGCAGWTEPTAAPPLECASGVDARTLAPPLVDALAAPAGRRT